MKETISPAEPARDSPESHPPTLLAFDYQMLYRDRQTSEVLFTHNVQRGVKIKRFEEPRNELL